MGEFFTRETWRRGKKNRLRKRTKPFTGRKTAPAAFLEAAKQTQFKPGRPGCRICRATKRDGTPCGRLALKELRVCEAHGGLGQSGHAGGSFSRRGDPRGSGPPWSKDGRSQRRFDLMRLRLYREADERTRMRLIMAWNTAAWPVLIRQIQLRNIQV